MKEHIKYYLIIFLRIFFSKKLADHIAYAILISYKYLRIDQKLRYRKEYTTHKTFDIFNFEANAQFAARIYTTEWYKENAYYGIDQLFKHYGQFTFHHKVYIEHGVYFGYHSAFDKGKLRPDPEAIITFGEARKEVLESKHKHTKVHMVGPYIQYADHFYPAERLHEVKQRLGKVLLVFPSHSTQFIRTDFDGRPFIDFIEQIRNGYDTVMICMYWKDIQDNRHKIYPKDYLIVTAGHLRDLNFLPRLRDIITLSDYTASNNIGTHIGYCLSLGLPHTIFPNNVTFEGINKPIEMIEPRSALFYQSFRQVEKELQDAFASFSSEVTESQIQLFNRYFGGDITLDKKDIFNIFFQHKVF